MRLYVKHCPVTCAERRPILEQHLKDRGFTDVKWITGYPADHPFVQWLYLDLEKYCNTSLISGLVKSFEAFEDLVNDPTIDSAMFCDDDAVFIKDWETKMQIPEGFPFVNMSVGVNFHIIPDGRIQEINNNGGCEVVWLTKDFARFMLQNVDSRQGGDIVKHAMVRFLGFPLVCSPIAQQTSILAPKSSTLKHDSKNTEDWKDYILNFKPTGLSYEELCNRSGLRKENPDELKKFIEREFFELFDMTIDIKNWEYIFMRALAHTSTSTH